MASPVFCLCGHNRSLTAFGLRHICGVSKCECVKHDTAKVDREAPTATIGSDVIDSEFMDRALMAATIEHQNKKIKTATELLQAGLRLVSAGEPDMAFRRFRFAIKVLGGLGAS